MGQIVEAGYAQGVSICFDDVLDGVQVFTAVRFAYRFLTLLFVLWQRWYWNMIVDDIRTQQKAQT